MKKILVALVVAVALYVGVSYVLGGQVRDRYFSALEENGGGVATLSNQSYERGLFTSRALTMVELRVPGGADDSAEPVGPSRFAVRHVFHHGPFPDPFESLDPMIAFVDSSVEPAEDGGELGDLFREFPELANTTSTVRVGMDGGVQGELLIPAFERNSAQGRFVWGGLTARASQDQTTGGLRGDYAAAGITAETPKGTLVMEGLVGRFDVVEALPLVYVGSVAGSLAALRAKDADDEALLLNDMRFTSDSEMAGNMIHYRQRIDIERVEAGGVICGPVVCDMEARNLDASALSELQAGIREIYKPGLDADAVSSRVEGLYVRFFERLLAGSPQFAVHGLKVPTSMGGMEATMDVRLDAPGAISAANILLLLRSIDAAAELSVDESLLVGLARLDLENKGVGDSGESADLDILARGVVDKQLAALLARNLVVREGDVLKTSAVLRQGRLQINGQETPLF